MICPGESLLFREEQYVSTFTNTLRYHNAILHACLRHDVMHSLCDADYNFMEFFFLSNMSMHTAMDTHVSGISL